MDVLVEAVDIEYPTKAERARVTSPLGRKPASRIIAHCEDGADRTMIVPMRVARAVERDLPDLPIEYECLQSAVFSKEDACCYAVVVEMLSRRDHARGELDRKLVAAGYARRSIDAAIERAQESRYQDDARFAAYFIEERKRRGWGRRKVEAELRARGVDIESIPGYPDRYFDDADDLDRARSLLSRKPVPSVRPFNKLVRHLMAKGFSYSVASTAARECIDGADIED